jgi:diguanylate cyclase (GGDEF)-like protein
MALAVSISGVVSVFLAARHAGPLAAGVVAGAAMIAVALLYEGQAARIGRACDHHARLASIDDLTGLANDRSFRVAMRTAGAARALALLDVDEFKPYNDTFGHPAGDAALREIGAILAGVAGGSTQLYRVGGDEFAVLFSGDGGPDPVETAGAIVRAVADHPWPLRPITVSIGLAPADDDEGSSLLDRADRALYRAKREGGIRVVARAPEGPQPA